MYILAITTKGKEFVYKANSAHKVSKSSAKKIMDIANKVRYKLSNDDECWHMYEVDQYDRAYDYAEMQRFTIYKGIVKEKFDY